MNGTTSLSAGTRWRDVGLSRRGLVWFLKKVEEWLGRLPKDMTPDEISKQVKMIRLGLTKKRSRPAWLRLRR